ncbi:hypothetical protein NC651_021472 [Populus alba x Populus x berolinensis]|nr:hypothetical protein NC651_021472 [Populus alba x Populus x berolinensis]
MSLLPLLLALSLLPPPLVIVLLMTSSLLKTRWVFFSFFLFLRSSVLSPHFLLVLLDHGVELPQIQEEAPHVEGWEQDIQEEICIFVC